MRRSLALFPTSLCLVTLSACSPVHRSFTTGTGGTGGATTSVTTTTGTGGTGGTGGQTTTTTASCEPSAAAGPVDDTCGVFVDAAGGDDTSTTPSKAHPLKTLTAAIARVTGGGSIYACSGQAFTESITLPAGAHLYGGLTCGTWAYDATVQTVLNGGADTVPLTLASGAGTTAIEDFYVQAAPATKFSGSSIAVVADGATAELTRCLIVASDAMTGQPGATPTGTVANGVTGGPGFPGCVTSSGPGGSPGGTTCPDGTSVGGPGGPALLGASEPGQPGIPGAPNQGNPGCTAGGAGAQGTPGTPGVGGQTVGTLSATGYAGAAGTDGGHGARGQGGGGGGTIGQVCGLNFSGGGGGGGGSGGCGGAGGFGGTAGGASIALASLSANLTLASVTLKTGKGGDGGAGTAGQTGGTGGPPGPPGSPGGCAGGIGGKGGNGGNGGGGRGGHSIGLAYTGTMPPSATVTFTLGTPGSGGTANGVPGAAGIGAQTQLFP